MTGRGSPMLNLRKSKVGKKKPSPKVCVEKSRASWNPGLEKALVDLLHEHNTPEHNLMAKKFHEKHQYANLTKILKDARKQSGASWNDQRCMIVAEPAVWANIIISFPRAKKFRNKPFPLFDALGELHDAEEEAARLARERAESSNVDDFSIKRCIAVLNTMEVTPQEKVKAYGVFKTIENRQIFINANPDSALLWLRSEMK
ncbi:hypothetical protein BRADI_3g53508v3 [Brachypodium distachyon]|uniref:Myb/SANT-like domain-containing protein n=1 Tax=Brachypodium distachyon TaxID=15368 RepID=A0A2K2D4W4_BRADI|nr:hypothetical protein BRADI_3g53508v3 [Brachypodium distachyon]